MSENDSQYPVQGAGLGLRRPSQGALDAVAFSEEQVEFRTGFGPVAQDDGRLAGELRFGVCRTTQRCEVVAYGFEAAIGAEAP